MTGDEIALLIATEAERINRDFIASDGNTPVFILAVVSMAAAAHDAITRCGLTPDMADFCRSYVDETLAGALAERGWTVKPPKRVLN